jgi:hypothetical protein
VITELSNLLSGKPIIIHNNNFQVFHEIFGLLGNRDFGCFFGSDAPKSPTGFYLSLYSLKNISSSFVETSKVQMQIFSIVASQEDF